MNMTTLEKIKAIADHIRNGHGQEVVHKYELAISSYMHVGHEWDMAANEPFETIWTKTKEYIDKRGDLDEPKLYVSDVIDMNDLKAGRLNLVYAPCGSGKTYFVENTLKTLPHNPEENMLYLAPTRSLVSALKFRGNPVERPDGSGGFVIEWRQAGITAMTYASFGSMIKRAQDNGKYNACDFWNDNSIICADELSQAVRQSMYNKDSDRPNLTRIALEELKPRIENESNTVVTVSATPRMLVDYYLFKRKPRDTASLPDFLRVVGMYLQPEGYKDGVVKPYYEFDVLLRSIGEGQRGLIYISQIEGLQEAVQKLGERGIRAECIFSDTNKDHTMNCAQNSIVDILLKEEKIPDDIQVLLINSAYETGLNIRPEKSHLDFIAVHDRRKDVQAQVRGRYRGDLDTLYLRESPENCDREIPEEIIAPYLDKRLMREDKVQLCSELGFRNSSGKLLGWTTVSRFLKEAGYKVDNTGKSNRNGKSYRYSVITK